jgi:hypothetical protein
MTEELSTEQRYKRYVSALFTATAKIRDKLEKALHEADNYAKLRSEVRGAHHDLTTWVGFTTNFIQEEETKAKSAEGIIKRKLP